MASITTVTQERDSNENVSCDHSLDSLFCPTVSNTPPPPRAIPHTIKHKLQMITCIAYSSILPLLSNQLPQTQFPSIARPPHRLIPLDESYRLQRPKTVWKLNNPIKIYHLSTKSWNAALHLFPSRALRSDMELSCFFPWGEGGLNGQWKWISLFSSDVSLIM